MVPAGRHTFLYAAVKGGANQGPLQSGWARWIRPARAGVLQDASSLAVYAEGYLLYAQENTLIARPFDATRLVFTGNGGTVAESLRVTSFGAMPALTQRSRYRPAAGWRISPRSPTSSLGSTATGTRWVCWTASGVSQSLGAASGCRPTARRHPHGRCGRQSGYLNLRSAERLPTRFTSDPGDDEDGIWSPDGKTIVFDSNRRASTLSIGRQSMALLGASSCSTRTT